jgi:hypothetical protein
MRNLLSTLLACTLLAAAGAVQASLVTYNVTLSPEAVGAQGSGSATVVFDDSADTLTLHVEFSGLSGTTTAAHIHCCTMFPETGTVGVATTTPTFAGFPSGVSSGTYDATLNLLLPSSYNAGFLAANSGSAAQAETALLNGMAQGRSYLNIHTSTFGGGEIRGFLVASAVPEPGGLALLALGGAMLLASRRRGGRNRQHAAGRGNDQFRTG